MVEVSLTVGKLDASLALLLTKDHHLIEFPTILLPNGVTAGSIIKIKCEQDKQTEESEAIAFQKVQDEILNTFGKNLPEAPVLKVRNVTQTSCVLEWDDLNLGSANLKNLVLFKDGSKLGSIPQPLSNKTTKLSGLPIDKTFTFQLRLDTTAGVYLSEVLEVTTHKMTDLSGINVCLGDITANDPFTVDDINTTLKAMGAHYPIEDRIRVDTTHYICTRENKSNPEFVKAGEMNIPIIRPEWLKACERERRIVGVRDFYVKDCVLPDILANNYWGVSTSHHAPNEPVAAPVQVVSVPEPVEKATEKTTEPAEKTTEPAEKTTEPAEKIPEVVEPVTETTEPTAEASEPIITPAAEESEPVVEPIVKESEPVEPIVKESEPVEPARAAVVEDSNVIVSQTVAVPLEDELEDVPLDDEPQPAENTLERDLTEPIEQDIAADVPDDTQPLEETKILAPAEPVVDELVETKVEETAPVEETTTVVETAPAVEEPAPVEDEADLGEAPKDDSEPVAEAEGDVEAEAEAESEEETEEKPETVSSGANKSSGGKKKKNKKKGKR